jgi:hypothetical protein
MVLIRLDRLCSRESRLPILFSPALAGDLSVVVLQHVAQVAATNRPTRITV